MEKKSNLWFWMLLALFIFLLYCISTDRLYCTTSLEVESDPLVQHAAPDGLPSLYDRGFTRG